MSYNQFDRFFRGHKLNICTWKVNSILTIQRQRHLSDLCAVRMAILNKIKELFFQLPLTQMCSWLSKEILKTHIDDKVPLRDINVYEKL